MTEIIKTIIEQYGIYGLLLIAIVVLGYMIWGDRKNNWGKKIDNVCTKIDSLDTKIESVETTLDRRIDIIEVKVSDAIKNTKKEDLDVVRTQSHEIISTRQGGKLSKLLRSYCDRVNCDHIFLGSFHNGTADLRGIHYCKFDIILDEFRDPMHLEDNDCEFSSLYKDENVIIYGDLPHSIARVGAAVLNVNDKNNTLLDMSDVIYRRCVGRGVKSIGFSAVSDKDDNIIGFVGCITYKDKSINLEELKSCSQAVEYIYNERN